MATTIKDYRANVRVLEGRDVGAKEVTRRITVTYRIAVIGIHSREQAVERAQTLYNACLDAINDEYAQPLTTPNNAPTVADSKRNRNVITQEEE